MNTTYTPVAKGLHWLMAVMILGLLALAQSLEQHLHTINERLEHHERLDCLAVVTELWTPENGYVTPTFKVKRDKIEEAYAPRFEAWVQSGQPVVWVNRGE